MPIPTSFGSMETGEAYVLELLALGNDQPGAAPAAKANRSLLYGRDRGGIEGKMAVHLLCEDGTTHVFGDLSGIRTMNPGAVLEVGGLDGNTDILRLVGSGGTTRFSVTDSGAVSGLLSFSGALTVSLPALGTTSTDGLVLTNPTAAATNAQQISPRLRLTGQGWKTDASAESQTIDWMAQAVPVQGAVSPQARLDLNYQINATGYQSVPPVSLLNSNVGIGEPVPTGMLHITSPMFPIGNQIKLTRTTDRTWGMKISAGLHFVDFDSNTTRLFLENVSGNIGLNILNFGANATGVLAFGGPATAPTTSPANVVQIYPINVAGAGTMGLAWRSEDGGIGALGSRNGFGLQSPTAIVHLAAGTATLAPLKLTAGTNLTTPQAGAAEYDGTNLYFSDGTATRRTLYATGGVKVALADGGTNASLTASNGGIFYSTATAGAILAGTATAGQILRSGLSAAPSWSTATYPATATGAGTILRADGTNFLASTLTIPDTVAINTLLYASAANVISALATANNGILVTGATGIPAISTDLPTAVTIGGAAIYRVGGATKVAVADGGTGVGSWTNGQLLVGNTTGNTAALATLTGTANQITVTNGASSITLATPQSIGTTSTPQFGGIGIGQAATANLLSLFGTNPQLEIKANAVAGVSRIVGLNSAGVTDWYLGQDNTADLNSVIFRSNRAGGFISLQGGGTTETIRITGPGLGFYGVAPVTRPTAYTQTYALATKTHNNFTSADLATTASTQTTPWGFATQAQADNIATQFNALRVDMTNLKQLVNSVIDDLQANGLLQ